MASTIYVLLSPNLKRFFTSINAETTLVSWTDDFSEGPLTKNFGSDNFWMNRYAYVEDKYQLSHLQYFESTIKPIVTLHDLDGVKEVILLNTNSLASQFNLLAIGSYLLESYRKDIKYSIINLNIQKLNSESLLNLNLEVDNNGVKITRNNLLFLQNSWLTLMENSKESFDIKTFNHSKFPFLKKQISKFIEKE